MLQALQSSFIYDRLIISWVNELPQPELAAEVCRLHDPLRGGGLGLCAGVYEDKLILSVRVAACRTAEAGDLLRQVVGKLGRPAATTAAPAAASRCRARLPSAIEQVQGELRRRLLKALNIDECRGQRLVSRREMLAKAIKRLRTNPLAEFELRAGDLRALYNVVGDEVVILIVGRKLGNKRIVEGEEFHGHQNHPAKPPGDGTGKDAK
jgi:hypothetical protein